MFPAIVCTRLTPAVVIVVGRSRRIMGRGRMQLTSNLFVTSMQVRKAVAHHVEMLETTQSIWDAKRSRGQDFWNLVGQGSLTLSKPLVDGLGIIFPCDASKLRRGDNERGGGGAGLAYLLLVNSTPRRVKCPTLLPRAGICAGGMTSEEGTALWSSAWNVPQMRPAMSRNVSQLASNSPNPATVWALAICWGLGASEQSVFRLAAELLQVGRGECTHTHLPLQHTAPSSTEMRQS
ncbi:hypothetical protein DFH27DRAFT_111279 [Peziza echinospora]|nr:hypothetical protein DFH27DRAFT_111279 [Peziza echinospora]